MSSKRDKWINLLKEKKAVLYDFDGVLVDSEPFYFKSYAKAFSHLGHKLIKKEYWKYFTFLGVGVKGENERYKLGYSPAQIQWILDERRKNYSAFVKSGAVPFIQQTFQTISLFQKMGLKTSIASNSFEDDLFGMFKAHGVKRNIMIVGRKKGLRTKPKPDVFVYAAGRLNITPADCLVIEDADKGLSAAKTVGMSCAIIRNRLNRGFDFEKADIVFNSADEFLSLTREALTLGGSQK